MPTLGIRNVTKGKFFSEVYLVQSLFQRKLVVFPRLKYSICPSSSSSKVSPVKSFLWNSSMELEYMIFLWATKHVDWTSDKVFVLSCGYIVFTQRSTAQDRIWHKVNFSSWIRMQSLPSWPVAVSRPKSPVLLYDLSRAKGRRDRLMFFLIKLER